MRPKNVLNSAEPPALGWRCPAVKLDRLFHQHTRYGLGPADALPGELTRKKQVNGFLTVHQNIHLVDLEYVVK